MVSHKPVNACVLCTVPGTCQHWIRGSHGNHYCSQTCLEGRVAVSFPSPRSCPSLESSMVLVPSVPIPLSQDRKWLHFRKRSWCLAQPPARACETDLAGESSLRMQEEVLVRGVASSSSLLLLLLLLSGACLKMASWVSSNIACGQQGADSGRDIGLHPSHRGRQRMSKERKAWKESGR